MFHRIVSNCGVLASSVFGLAAGGAAAATLEPVTMEDIVKVDALGFSCVYEDDLELAFAATGKKDGVVPQSCLPKPCDRLLEPDQLAEFLGRNPTEDRWDDYVARYAEYCVAETGGPWPEDVLFANASDVMDDDDFWDGIAGTELNSGVGSDVLETFVPQSAVLPAGLVVPRPPQTISAALPTPPVIVRPRPIGVRPASPIPISPVVRPPVVPPIVPVVVPPSEPPVTPPEELTVEPPVLPPVIPPVVPPVFPPQPPAPPTPPIVVPPSPVPLPGTLGLLLGALGATWASRRVMDRRRTS